MARLASRLLSCCVLCSLPGVLAAAQSVKLSPPLGGDRDVRRYVASPDGRRVVYEADQRVNDQFELFSVDVRGEKRVRRLAPQVQQFAISADSRLVVFALPAGLFSIAIDGSGDAKPLANSRSSFFALSPDGANVVFLTDDGLFRVPIDGRAAPALVQSSFPYRVHSSSIAFTPDGRRVIYITEGSIGHEGGAGHAYSALLDGSAAPVRLNDGNTRASIGSFLVSPDSRWLLYRLGASESLGRALLCVPVDGSARPVALNPPLVAGSNLFAFQDAWGPTITPDGTHVVFSIDSQTLDLYELFYAPLDGSAPAVQISTPPIDPFRGYPKLFRVSPDGQSVVYGVGDWSRGPFELYVVPTTGGVPARMVNDPLPPGSRVRERFAFTPDGARVLYIADPDVVGRFELLLVPLDGSAPAVKLSDPSLSDSNVDTFEVMPDGNTVVYGTSRRVGSQRFYELFAVPLQGSTPVRLDGPTVTGGSVRFDGAPLGQIAALFRPVLNGTRVVYLADQDKDEVVELYASPLFTCSSTPSVRR